MSQQVRIYSSDLRGRGIISTFREMIDEQVASRELTWRLFVRDFSARYKQSVLGVLWALIVPLFTLIVFVSLQEVIVPDVAPPSVPYPIYGVLGITFWQIFSVGLTLGAGSIVAGGSLVIKINFPKECLVFASVGQSLIEFLIRLSLVIGVFIFYDFLPAWQSVFLPIVLLPLWALTLGLSLLLSLLNVVIRDVEKSLGMVITLLLFISPIMYEVPANGPISWLAYWNPLVPLIDGPRQMVLTGQLPISTSFLFSSLFSFVFFLISWWLFHLAEKRIAERV